jgi:hypothetical protein
MHREAAMQLSQRFFAGAAVAAALLAACGGGDSTGPGNGGGGGGSASMTGTVAGQSWTAEANLLQVIAGGTPGSLIITGIENGTGGDYVSVTLMLSFIEASGLYPIGVNIGSTPGGSGTIIIQENNTPTTWLTPLSAAAGSVTVQGFSSTSTRMRGAFAFVAAPLLGSGPEASIINGSFDVPLPSGFTRVTPSTRGSTFTATLGGFPWYGATVVGVGDINAGAFSIGGTSTGYSVQVVTATQATVGDFPLGQTSGMNLTVQQFGTTNVWGSGPGASGTVSYTSLSNGRVVGTFTGTLAPIAPTVGNLTVADGTFDVVIP